MLGTLNKFSNSNPLSKLSSPLPRINTSALLLISLSLISSWCYFPSTNTSKNSLKLKNKRKETKTHLSKASFHISALSFLIFQEVINNIYQQKLDHSFNFWKIEFLLHAINECKKDKIASPQDLKNIIPSYILDNES